MNRPAFHRTLFLAALLVASTAFAGAEVNKCVDGDGRITLTDEPCPAGAHSELLASTPGAAPLEDDAGTPEAASHGEALQRVVAAPARLRHDTWVKKPVPGRRFAVDIATLKAARQNLRQFDHAAATMRSGRLAGLN